MSYVIISLRGGFIFRAVVQTGHMPMIRPKTLNDGRRVFREIAAGYPAAVQDRFKLDRLLELRAVIDSLRRDRYSSPLAVGPATRDRDPLP